MDIKTLKIAGMSCQHCVMAVKNQLSTVATVKEVTIGKAVVEIDPSTVGDEMLTKAIANAGYEVVSIS